MPVYVCHGAKDEVIPVTWSRELAKEMAGRASFHYEEQPGGDHETPLTAMPHALEWVLERMR
jgi:predicted esterase